MLRKIIIAIFGLILISSLAVTQEKPPFKEGNKKMGFLDRLNLTDEQSAKLKDMRFEQEKKQIDLRSKIQTLNVEVKQLLSAEKIDKTGLEKKYNEIAKLQVEQKMNFINHWSQVNSILTPEQQKVWKETLKRFDGPRNNFVGDKMIERRQMRGFRMNPSPDSPNPIEK
jgi:Spy/CpxP family protein refolding chaperone